MLRCNESPASGCPSKRTLTEGKTVSAEGHPLAGLIALLCV